MSARSFLFAAAMGCLVVCGMTGAAQARQPRTAISAPWAVGPDGSLMKDVTVIIVGGRIERVIQGPADVAVDRTIRFESGVISPGLIDVASTLGVVGDNIERKSVFDPDASVVDALDALSPALRAAGQAGVTAAMIRPAPSGIISGSAATVRTISPPGAERIIRGDGPLAVTLGPGSWDVDLGPTSRAGVLHELREAMRAAKADGGASRLARMVRGELDVIIEADSAEDVDAALRLFGQYSLTPVFRHASDAVETASELGQAKALVVVGPYTYSSELRLLVGPARLASAGCEVAFCGGLPFLEADALRLSAALAVRYGLDPAAARRGLTINAARAAGLGNRVGALTPGADADIVIFSGDPVRLDSRVLEVWIAGERVHQAPSQAPQEADGWKAWEE